MVARLDDWTPSRRGGLHVRGIEGDIVILDAANGRMHNLNPTAAFIFDSIDGRKTEAEISRCVAHTFEVGFDVAERDTRNCIEKFREEKLVV
ncbi:MAG TPA: PqqD family protein [Planctomycetota bacterium]|jgi:hypothetical protein|nr:PqqD family protein [Planctomycetota bacterium]